MEDIKLMEKELSDEMIYDGTIMSLHRLTVELPSGKTAFREVIRHVGAAAIVPIDEDGNVVMVRQHRAALNRVILEIPAGKKEGKDEDGLVVAKRELEEETGLIAKTFIHLTDLLTTPGYSDEVISLYLALDLTQGKAHPDEDEFLNVVKIPFEKVFQMAVSGELNDTKTLCAILLAKEAIKVL